MGNFIVSEVILYEDSPSGGSSISFLGDIEIIGEFVEGGEVSAVMFSVAENDIVKIPNYYIAEGVGLIITNLNDFVDSKNYSDILNKSAKIKITDLSLVGEEGSDYFYNCELVNLVIDLT